MRRLRIALVSDYFYPSVGGVETHIMMLATELTKLGHTVIVVTHSYGKYQGKMAINGIVVYYLGLPVVAANTTFPTLYCGYLLYRRIFQEHEIDIVHGHQSMSTMGLEGVYQAQHLNIRTVLTEHSVFEFSKIERIICNSLGKFICRGVDRVICVSKTACENTAKRLEIPEDRISIIPNGIDGSVFYPGERRVRDGKVTVLFCARFVFRKGIDLLVEALPRICANKRIIMVIAGDGPMRSNIEQVIDEYNLHEQVKLVGACDYSNMPDLLRSADIFLNTSLTETFCMAILEAVACGLLAVSTNVGGIHEIFESGDIYFCKPEPEDIANQINKAMSDLPTHDPGSHYKKLIKKYDWRNVAEDVENVYKSILKNDSAGFSANKPSNFISRFLTWLMNFQQYILRHIED